MPRPAFTEVLCRGMERTEWKERNESSYASLCCTEYSSVAVLCHDRLLADWRISSCLGQFARPGNGSLGCRHRSCDVVLTPAENSASLIKTQTDGHGMYEFR